MRKKKKYLPLYFEWMESGGLSKGGHSVIGLCSTVLVHEPLFDLITPTDQDLFDNHSRLFWAREDVIYAHGKMSPLRQNLILLMCAMNGEL